MSIFSPECADCKRHSDKGKWDWESCLGKEWWIKDEWFYLSKLFDRGELDEFYEPPDIKFCPRQIKWILENVWEFKHGNWPTNPMGEGDCETHTFNHHAPYETAEMVIGELEARLNKCGDKLFWIQEVYYEDLTIEHVARRHSEKPGDIEYYIKKVIKYCSGYKRKRLTFKEWANRNYRRKR